jgi:Zn-finger protein
MTIGMHHPTPRHCKCTHRADDHPYDPVTKDRGACLLCLCPVYKEKP